MAGRSVIAAAIRGAKTADSEKYASACDNEKKWRFQYQKHFMNMVKVSAESPEAALGVANAGADYMHSHFDFVDPNTGAVTNFNEYMNNAAAYGSFHSATISGTGRDDGKPLTVNYKGTNLQGAALKDQLAKWASYGTIEPDAANSLSKLAEGKVNLHGQHFVLIGAGSAMGPFYKLLEHGATVVCVDIPGTMGPRAADMWARLIKTARESSGSIIIPLTKAQKDCKNDEELIAAAGCNLIEQPAQILNWLSDIAKGQPLTIGNYTYLDGDLHVKLSIAADAIIKHMRLRRPKDVAAAFLCTPTDIHVVPDAAHRAAQKNYGWHPGRLLEAFIQIASMGKFLRKNALPALKNNIKVVDGLSVAQGPNYALAKRLQHWRSMIEYNAGAIVSTSIAPSTATLSVVSNKTFGWAYGGMPYFKPFEIFQQETTNAVMGGLLIADVTQPDSAVCSHAYAVTSAFTFTSFLKSLF